ncbi:MAG: DUF2782 domain-containing protein [Chromatiales bacterium]
MNRRALFVLAALALTLPATQAQDDAPPPPPMLGDEPRGDIPPPPPYLEGTEDSDVMEPEVEIIRRGETTIEEYRVNGQLYMVRVVPQNAPPYYLVDADGDGELESRRDELSPNFAPPSWVLFRW